MFTKSGHVSIILRMTGLGEIPPKREFDSLRGACGRHILAFPKQPAGFYEYLKIGESR